MWHALRAELAYSRPWILGALGIAGAVALFVSVVLQVASEGSDLSVASGLRGFFPLIAGMVVGFIAQSYRSEERRARLLMAGPLTPQQVGGVAVLLPAILFGIGMVASFLVVAAELLISGKLEEEAMHMIIGMGGMFFGIGQTGPLGLESAAARRQKRPAALVGWSLFVLAIVLLTASQFILGSIYAIVGQLALGFLMMFVSWRLYVGRTDFTK